MSSSRLGEKLPPLDMRRPTCPGRSRRQEPALHLDRRVREGIRTPKWRVMDGLHGGHVLTGPALPTGPCGGPLDRVDQLVALDGQIEVDVEGSAATQSVGLRARTPARRCKADRPCVPFGAEPVLVGHRHGSPRAPCLCRHASGSSEAERAGRPDDDGAVSPVDLQSVAARIRGSGGHADRDLGARSPCGRRR